MSVTRIRPSLHERVSHLEERAKVHDTMAVKIDELYEAWTKAKHILGAMNWFWVKIVGGGFATLGGVAVLLTIYEKVRALL